MLNSIISVYLKYAIHFSFKSITTKTAKAKKPKTPVTVDGVDLDAGADLLNKLVWSSVEPCYLSDSHESYLNNNCLQKLKVSMKWDTMKIV